MTEFALGQVIDLRWFLTEKHTGPKLIHCLLHLFTALLVSFPQGNI